MNAKATRVRARRRPHARLLFRPLVAGAGLAALVAAFAPVSGWTEEPSHPEMVIPAAPGSLPAVALNPPDGTVVKLRIDAAAPDTSVDTDVSAEQPELVVQPAAGPLPWDRIAALQAEGVVLKLRSVPSGAAPGAEDGLAAANVQQAPPLAAEKVIAGPPGTALPLLALSPPEDTVVKLRLDDGARGSAGSYSDEDLGPSVAPLEMVVQYSGGPLPPEALSPPEETVVKLRLGGDAGAAFPTAAPADPKETDLRVMVIPYSGGELPAAALAPPEGTLVKLSVPDAE